VVIHADKEVRCVRKAAEGLAERTLPPDQHLGDSRMKKFATVVMAGAIALVLTANSAFAIKPFLDEFVKKYPTVSGAATAKCGVCHEGSDKKMRNAYGKALDALLEKGDAKDTAKIDGAFEKVAKDTPKFGENLKAGKLPTE
jgi:hypothetical protein